MKLTPQEEEAYTRRVAAQIGRDPEGLIREGEQLKQAGYEQAARAEQARMERAQQVLTSGGRAAAMYGDPTAEIEHNPAAAEIARKTGAWRAEPEHDADREAGQ